MRETAPFEPAAEAAKRPFEPAAEAAGRPQPM